MTRAAVRSVAVGGCTNGCFVWGASSAMRDLRARVDAAAPTGAAVLLVGETGTGKGAIARALHARSGRAGEPFVQFDCAGVAPSLIESALFGHERGAFTGAHERRIGRVEAAGAGTLFLDEIGELDATAQARLLRLLEDRAYERVGGGRTLGVAARIVAATHRDLGARVAAGAFRADLLHRLAVVALRVPTVRERREDLPDLLAAAAARAALRTGAPPPRIAPDGLAVLRAYAWPGNVREIMNAMERAAVCQAGRAIDAAMARRLVDLDAALRPVPEPGECAGSSGRREAPAPRSAPSQDVATLRAVLEGCGGNVSRAARLLGLPRSTLRDRLRALDAGAPRADAGQAWLPGLEPCPAHPGPVRASATPRPRRAAAPPG